MSQRITWHNGTAIATDSLYYRSTDRGQTGQVEMLSTKAGLYSYTYDADGLRTSKTVDNVAYNYTYIGSQLVRLTYGDNVLDFFYDANGTPIAMRHGYLSTDNYAVYYYVTNLQGDVIRLVDANGNNVAYYEYDPYGRAIKVSGSHANINPLRYRGYVYDTETGLYYLQSRYYDPVIGRFINADGQIAGVGGEVLGYNMFAYCMNNPVNMSDPTGNWPKWIKSAVNAVKTGAKKIAASVKSTLSKVDFKQAINKGKQIAKAAYTNVEISAGLGLGLYGEANIGDVVGLGFGISYNLIEVKFDDGKLALQQSYNEGLSASVLFVDVLQDASESGSRKLTLSSPMGDFIPDDYNSNWTIISAAAYPVAGGSLYVGFDMISFCQEIENIFFYPD